MSLADTLRDLEDLSEGWIEPGSEEAHVAGCPCIAEDRLNSLYIYEPGCPLHWPGALPQYEDEAA